MKVLLVEDDPLISQNIKNALTYFGYTVIGPESEGKDALNQLTVERPDLAILDIELKDDITGFDIAQKIMSDNPIPIIFITGMLDEKTRKKAKELGCSAFINKPFHERNLLNAIDVSIGNFSASERKNSEFELKSEKTVAAKDKIYIKRNERYVKVPLANIDFIEASGHYIVIHQGDEQLLVSHNMSHFLEEVNHPNFIRVHRSFAVNIENLPDFDDAFIYFPAKTVPISRKYKSVLKTVLKLY